MTMEVNRCLAFLLCDGASRAANGKINLHGIFDRIYVSESSRGPVGAERPAHLSNKTPLFFVFYKVIVKQPCTLQLKVEDPRGGSLNGNWRDEISVPGTIQTVWCLHLKDFAMDGSYTLRLVCNEGILSETTLAVSHAANGEPPSNQA
jgi:Family of unknown function (DUF6941)